jgi:cytochrome c oxidase subunit II
MSRHRTAAALLIALGLAASGCMPTPETTEAGDISFLYQIAQILAAGVGITVYGLLVFMIVRYRRRRSLPAGAIPPQIRGNNVLEVIWTGIPLLIVTVLFGLTVWTLARISDTQPGSDPVQLNVLAYRWGWRMTYSDYGVVVQSSGPGQGPQAVLPVNEPVNITLTSQDVEHSFFVPQFLYKRDAIPGMVNHFTIDIENPGVYAGQCAEFCGIYHFAMTFTIRAVSAADFQTWLTQQQAGQQPASQPPAAESTGSPSVAP